MSSYLLISLPASIVPSGDSEDAIKSISSSISSDTTLVPFAIPEFKIGTLDTLVLQADELAKIDTGTEGTVAKIADVLKNIFDGDDSRVKEHKTVGDKPFEQYLKNFSWNKVKYRADKTIAELLELLRKEIVSLDTDIKNKYTNYTQVKSNVQTLKRRQEGNLSTRSLAPIIKKTDFVPESEYLQTCFLAVPKQMTKEFIQSYETLSPMIVPRSANVIANDPEFILYSIVVFKKHAAEFSHKAREAKYVPREYTFSPTAAEEEIAETKAAESELEKLWGETLRLARTAYSDTVAAWIHLKTLRVFVESILRYGLPADFASAVLMGPGKGVRKGREALEGKFAYLGGNAYGRDKKGKVVRKDEAGVAEYTAGGGGEEYTPFVEYEFEVA